MIKWIVNSSKRVLLVCVPTSFVIDSSWLSKGKAKGKVIDSEVFWVFLGVI